MPAKSSALEAMDKATASRKAFLLKHPEFAAQNKPPEKRFEITPQMRGEAVINKLKDGEAVD